MTNTQCEICAYADIPEGNMYRTKYWRVALAPDQGYLGRSYVALLAHKESLSELSPEEWRDFEALVQKLETGYEKAFGSGRPFNWSCLMNNAFKVEPSSPHVHWHLHPRHKQPIELAGMTFTDPNYGHHYDKEHKLMVDNDVLEAIAAKIRAHL